MNLRRLALFVALMTVVARLHAALPSFAQADEPGISFVSPGSTLLYHVSNGKDLLVRVNPAPEGEREFEFIFAVGGPRGRVHVSKADATNAHALLNWFQDGENDASGRSSVWLSREVFSDLKAGKTVEIDLGGNDGKVAFTCKPEEGSLYPLSVAGRFGDIGAVGTLVAVGPNDHRIEILDNAEEPLILSMDTEAFRVELKGAF